ncbi:hypothetical protein BG004_004010 [Podila humilis]|nr:hypothetical protein BG004_004010 [Podila humilis]
MTAASVAPLYSYTPAKLTRPSSSTFNSTSLSSSTPSPSALASPHSDTDITLLSPSLVFNGRRPKRNSAAMIGPSDGSTPNKRCSQPPPSRQSPHILACQTTSGLVSHTTSVGTNISRTPRSAHLTPDSTISPPPTASSSSSSFFAPVSRPPSTHTKFTKSKSVKSRSNLSPTSTSTSGMKPLQFIHKVAPPTPRPVEIIGPYVQSQSAIRQKARKQLREEGKIKRISNCFIIYRTAVHPTIVERFGHLNNKEISCIAGAWWRNESDETKMHYRKLALDEKSKHAIFYPRAKTASAKAVIPSKIIGDPMRSESTTTEQITEDSQERSLTLRNGTKDSSESDCHQQKNKSSSAGAKAKKQNGKKSDFHVGQFSVHEYRDHPESNCRERHRHPTHPIPSSNTWNEFSRRIEGSPPLDRPTPISTSTLNSTSPTLHRIKLSKTKAAASTSTSTSTPAPTIAFDNTECHALPLALDGASATACELLSTFGSQETVLVSSCGQLSNAVGLGSSDTSSSFDWTHTPLYDDLWKSALPVTTIPVAEPTSETVTTSMSLSLPSCTEAAQGFSMQQQQQQMPLPLDHIIASLPAYQATTSSLEDAVIVTTVEIASILWALIESRQGLRWAKLVEVNPQQFVPQQQQHVVPSTPQGLAQSPYPTAILEEDEQGFPCNINYTHRFLDSDVLTNNHCQQQQHHHGVEPLTTTITATPGGTATLVAPIVAQPSLAPTIQFTNSDLSHLTGHPFQLVEPTRNGSNMFLQSAGQKVDGPIVSHASDDRDPTGTCPMAVATAADSITVLQQKLQQQQQQQYHRQQQQYHFGTKVLQGGFSLTPVPTAIGAATAKENESGDLHSIQPPNIGSSNTLLAHNRLHEEHKKQELRQQQQQQQQQEQQTQHKHDLFLPTVHQGTCVNDIFPLSEQSLAENQGSLAAMPSHQTCLTHDEQGLRGSNDNGGDIGKNIAHLEHIQRWVCLNLSIQRQQQQQQQQQQQHIPNHQAHHW